MRTRLLVPAVPLAAILLSSGCASSLREPPPLAALGGPVPAGRAPGATDVDRLLQQAEAGLTRRPDTAAVEQARKLFLAAARADESRSEGLLGAARATAWLVDHEPDSARRGVLATAGVQTCQWCIRRFAGSAECRYRLALALGEQARERPATAMDALPRIVALLEEVIATAPQLDEAGGDRVLALVLLRAPGWPAGPGDPDSGLEHARKAVELAPEYPPNWLTLGEALAATGRHDEARAAYRRAAELAQSRATAGDPDATEWAKQAAAGIS
jgi:tetratricopeptide (TPR) repeat protein